MLFISNEDVQRVLTVEDALDALEEGHRELARQELVARPRVDIYTETERTGAFHRWGTMEGASKGLQRIAIRMKSDVVSWRDHGEGRVEDKYCVEPGQYCGLVLLFDTNTGEPLAVINDGYLQHIRVGALAGLSTKYLARQDAATVGMLGAGGMAHSHLQAFAAVRPITSARVYSPTRAHREAFALKMSEELGIEVVPCDGPEEAVRGAAILSTCTNAITPTVFGHMVEDGMHLTQVYSGEFAADVVPTIDLTVGGDPLSQVVSGVPVDDSQGFTTYLAGGASALSRARSAGSLSSRADAPAEPSGTKSDFSGRVLPLVDLIEGRIVGRRSDDEVSASNGVRTGGGKQGLQFVTVGSLVYDRARAAGLGRYIPTEWFLQDIRD